MYSQISCELTPLHPSDIYDRPTYTRPTYKTVRHIRLYPIPLPSEQIPSIPSTPAERVSLTHPGHSHTHTRELGLSHCPRARGVTLCEQPCRLALRLSGLRVAASEASCLRGAARMTLFLANDPISCPALTRILRLPHVLPLPRILALPWRFPKGGTSQTVLYLRHLSKCQQAASLELCAHACAAH